MSKFLVASDLVEASRFKTTAEATANALQSISDEMKAINLPSLQAGDIEAVVSDVPGFVRRKTLAGIGELPKIAGLEIDTNALKMPDHSKLQIAVKNLQGVYNRHGRQVQHSLFNFEKDAITVNAEKLEQSLESFNTYAETPEAQKAAKVYQKFIDVSRELDDLLKSKSMQGMMQQQTNNLYRQDGEGRLILNIHFYNTLK